MSHDDTFKDRNHGWLSRVESEARTWSPLSSRSWRPEGQSRSGSTPRSEDAGPDLALALRSGFCCLSCTPQLEECSPSGMFLSPHFLRLSLSCPQIEAAVGSDPALTLSSATEPAPMAAIHGTGNLSGAVWSIHTVAHLYRYFSLVGVSHPQQSRISSRYLRN